MRITFIVAVIALGALNTGCHVLGVAAHRVAAETALCLNQQREQKRNCQLAETAWASIKQAHPETYSADFEAGFKDGFVDYLYAGGTGEPRALPARRYCSTRHHSLYAGQAHDDWCAGFRYGAAVAQESGYREEIIVRPWCRATVYDTSPGAPGAAHSLTSVRRTRTGGLPMVPPPLSPLSHRVPTVPRKDVVARPANTAVAAPFKGAPTASEFIQVSVPTPATSAASAQLSLVLQDIPSDVCTGVPFMFTVAVVDGHGAMAADYSGTIHFESSDRQASLPAKYTFATSDRGTKTFEAVFHNVGDNTLVVSEMPNPQSPSVPSPVRLSSYQPEIPRIEEYFPPKDVSAARSTDPVNPSPLPHSQGWERGTGHGTAGTRLPAQDPATVLPHPYPSPKVGRGVGVREQDYPKPPPADPLWWCQPHNQRTSPYGRRRSQQG